MMFNFRYIGQLDIQPFRQKLQQLDWDTYTLRQQKHQVHHQTKTVPLIFDPLLNLPLPHRSMGLFIQELEHVKTILSSFYGPGTLLSAILIKLPSGANVLRHIDKGQPFHESHRIHIPIQTNEGCIFEVDGEEKHLREGEIWEIDNAKKYHSVRNTGSTDRIHLLVDWRLT